MTELVVKLRLEADGKGMVGEVKLTEAELAKLSKTARDTETATSALSTGLSAAGVAGRALSVAAGLAATSVAALAGKLYADAIPAALEAEKAQSRLAGVLAATGHSAGLTAGQINDMADALAASTQFDDESIRNAAATLATFRNVQGATFREGLKLAADYAALTGGDVTSAAHTLSRAFDSPTQGLAALTRAGITFTEAQKEQIKTFEETGRLAQAQGIVSDQLKAKFGGLAEAMNTGLNKSTNDLKKGWDELAEAAGNKLAPSFNAVAASAASALAALKGLLSAGETAGAGDPVAFISGRVDALRAKLDEANQELTDEANSIFGLSAGEEAEITARIERIKGEIIKAATEANDYAKRLQAQGIKTPEQDAAAGAAAAAAQREAQAAKAARDKEELTALEARSVAANQLKEIHDQMYDAVLTPQEKYFNRLKEIAEVERVYGEEIAGRASQKAGEQFIADEAASPQGRETAAFDAAQAQQQAQSAARLAEIETSLQTENERIEAAYLAREFMLEDARQRGLVSEQRYHELSTQMWAQSEAEKSAIDMREAEQREQRDATEFQNKMRWADMGANLLGSFASLSEGRGKSAFETSQRLARAQTIVSTASAAMKAFAWGAEWGGPPAGAAAAAVAVAAGLAQLNKINETKYSGGGSIATATGGGAGGSVPGTSGGVSSPGASSAGSASGAGNGGITQITIIGSSGDTLTVGQMEQAFDHIRDGIARGDKILIERQSMQAQILSAA